MHQHKVDLSYKISLSFKKFVDCSFSWPGLLFYTYFAISIYLLFEGLFILTKPSSYSVLPFFEKISLWLFAGTLFSIAATLIFLFVFLSSRLPILNKQQRFLKYIILLIPVAVLSALFLIQIDNITYTAFGRGIATTDDFRFIYLILFFGLIIYFYFIFSPKFLEFYELIGLRIPHKYFVPTLVLINIILLLFTYQPNEGVPFSRVTGIDSEKNNLPNIVFITADGLSATQLSAYGYYRDTTPKIKEISKTSLVAENAFANGSNTEGSLVSLYTGRYPSSTRVLIPPDILKGDDAYLHMPGILRSMGYFNVQLTFPYYADAFDENLLGGFDFANGRSFSEKSLFYVLNNHIQTDRAHFVYEVVKRNLDRLGHIFYVQGMANLQALANSSAQYFDDATKIKKALEVLNQSDQPVFIHIHWLGTHGPTFLPNSRKYSSNKDIENQQNWDTDFYDDTIVDFDKTVDEIYRDLSSMGLLDKTILLIASDHGQRWNSFQRIPLIIHFPNNEYSGHIKNNVQLLDVAPTILDYLNYEIPTWMEGRSLLEPSITKPIFIFNILGQSTKNESVTGYNMDPPFFQFGYIGIVYCDRIYKINLKESNLQIGTIREHTAPCPEGTTPSNETVIQWMIDHLRDKGFNVENLEKVSIE